MVKNGQAGSIRNLRYQPEHSGAAGVEVLSFAELRGMPAGAVVPQLQRADFHVLGIVTAGRGAVAVDFDRHPIGAGVAVWIRPGWLHRWDDIADCQGVIVLFRPELAPQDVPVAGPLGPVRWVLGNDAGLVRAAAEHLRREFGAPPGPVSGPILRNLLEVLLLRIGESAPEIPTVDGVFADFAVEVEKFHRQTRELAWYAERLGYAPRTVTRATQRAVGTGAKQYIDDRVVLEAKRLLAHAGITVAECARRVGFDDAANFAKFFTARAGCTPGAFAAGFR
ncbi:helix-turn-helix domain-containing protein [Nocardia arthritidis]|uniref:Helix-turn-helix domain-containing protein n=1 Tax=Nocardia arthritidis TaxID=228602 RepID=A0A6G9Y5B7_9NOCA|nr:AraC family transcriptional regulator [Nocardia arthritidis]QIS08391.1 helix-turn-helix domain-containing protein [Nocardia arthritidis]